MKIVKMSERHPNWYVNVFVKYTLHYQDFWTRGYFNNGIWTVMLWSGQVTCPIEYINEWMEIPNINA